MSRETTLARIEHEIANGDLGKARDRLHGLVAGYPDDLTLRERLGDVYWRLQYPAMAGRYWYLVQERSPEMELACQAFERACGGEASHLLRALRFKGNLETIGGTHAGRTLAALQERAGAGPAQSKVNGTPASSQQATVFLISCLLIVAAVGVLIVIGLITVAARFF
jgi:hypothetical protein